MSSVFEKMVTTMVDSVKHANSRETEGYDTDATVTRVDGSTAWVHIGGGVDETPVKKTINCKAGDTVQVRVGDGTAFLIGNLTAPPTDDSKPMRAVESVSKAVGKVKTIAENAAKIAGNTTQYFWHLQEGSDTGAHITEIPKDRFLADPEHGGGNLLARSNGIAIRDGLNELAIFASNLLRIGPVHSYGGPFIELSSDGLDVWGFDSGTQENYQVGRIHPATLGGVDDFAFKNTSTNVSLNISDEVMSTSSVRALNGFYSGLHNESIGTVKSATASKNTPVSDITDYNDGPSVTLNEGTWIVIGTWIFASLGDSTARQTSVQLEKGGSVIKTITTCNGASWATRMEITDIVVVSSSDDPCAVGLNASTSRATSTASTQTIKAIRIL